MNRNKIITIIIFGLMILVTAFVLIKTDFANKIFKTKADTNSIALQDNEAMLRTGKEVNAKMKEFAGDSYSSYQSLNENITKIMKSNTIPNSYKTDDYIVSISESPKPIYMWFDDGTIYYYTDATKIYMNEDSSYMFLWLVNTASIDVSNFDTSKVTDMSHMFSECNSLISLNLSNFNTTNVTNMAAMFSNCSSLTALNLSNFNTSNVTRMSYMFSGCENLVSLDLSSFNTSNVTNMEWLFSQCKKIKNLNLSSFSTSKVTNMEGMFCLCSSLETLILGSNFNTSNITSMWRMFDECESLTSLDVSNFDTSKVTNAWSAFRKCKLLTMLDVSNFDTSNITNMEDMFRGCSSITILDLSSFDTRNVTNMDGIFGSCSSLTTIYVSNRFVIPENMNMLINNCFNIRGAKGTTYHVSQPNKRELFKIDEGEISPGYFSVNIDKLKLTSNKFHINEDENYVIITESIDQTNLTSNMEFDVVKNGNKVNIVYNTLTLKSYDAYDISSLDVREDKIMFNEIKTLNELKNTLNTDSIVLKDKDDNIKDGSSKLGTGNKLVIGDKTYTISVKGDLSGDGIANFEDVFSSYYYFKNSNQSNDVYRYAADFNGDNLVEFEDVFSMYYLFKNSTN